MGGTKAMAPGRLAASKAGGAHGPDLGGPPVAEHEGPVAPAGTAGDGSVSPGAGAARARWAAALIASSLFVILSLAMVGRHIQLYTHLDAIDEQAHLDYALRVQAGTFPAYGDRLSAGTLRALSCHGLEDAAGGSAAVPDCSVPYDRPIMENYNYEAGQPPLYYAVSATVARFLPFDDPLTSLRAVGALWLAAGSIAVWAGLRLFRVRAALAWCITAAFSLTPGVLHAAAIVSNDGAMWAFGGVTLMAVAWLARAPHVRPYHLAALVGMGVVGGLLKPVALLAALMAGAAIGCQYLAGHAPDRLRLWRVLVTVPRRSILLAAGLAVAMPLGVVVSSLAWGGLVLARQHQLPETIPPMSVYHADHFDVANLLTALTGMVSPGQANYMPAVFRSGAIEAADRLSRYVQTAALLLPVVTWRNLETRFAVVSYTVAVAVSGPYYAMLFYVTTHQSGWGSQPRFGIVLFPLALVGLCTWPSRRWQPWLLAALLGLPGVVMAVQLVRPPH